MTEMRVRSALAPALRKFVVHWGEMGQTWGVNRSVAQIHAVLFVSEHPMTAEEITDCLGIARSNVSTSLKELMGWSLVRRVQVLGDRRDYFEAEADMFEMVRRIALGRKAREIEPAIVALQTCVGAAARDRNVSAKVRRRLDEMLEFTQSADRSVTEILALPAPVVKRLMRMGGAIARFVAAGRTKTANR